MSITTNQYSITPEPEALRRYLLSLSFPFVEVTDNEDIESYGLEPPLNGDDSYMIPEPQEKYEMVQNQPHSWPATPAMSSSNTPSSSANSSMPTTPLLTPVISSVPLSEDLKIKDYFSEHEHYSLKEKVMAWGVNHLHALEAFVQPHDEPTTCLPAPEAIYNDAHIVPASVGAQVRFLLRPMPPKHEEVHSHPLSPLVAAVAGGLFGYGDSDELLAAEEYEMMEDAFGLE